MTFSNIGTHVTHCCLRHGCKYGDLCPVVSEEYRQEGPCEWCRPPIEIVNDLRELEAELAWSDSVYSNPRQGFSDADLAMARTLVKPTSRLGPLFGVTQRGLDGAHRRLFAACRCGHAKEAHQHYRGSSRDTACSRCNCNCYRAEMAWWERAWDNFWDFVERKPRRP